MWLSEDLDGSASRPSFLCGLRYCFWYLGECFTLTPTARSLEPNYEPAAITSLHLTPPCSEKKAVSQNFPPALIMRLNRFTPACLWSATRGPRSGVGLGVDYSEQGGFPGAAHNGNRAGSGGVFRPTEAQATGEGAARLSSPATIKERSKVTARLVCCVTAAAMVVVVASPVSTCRANCFPHCFLRLTKMLFFRPEELSFSSYFSEPRRKSGVVCLRAGHCGSCHGEPRRHASAGGGRREVHCR